MEPPAGYFYRQGYYWRVDGTGPYRWDGAAMQLVHYGVLAESTASVQSDGFFNRDTSGPATKE